MMAAEMESGGGLTVLAEDRQVTRLGESVFRGGEVDRDAMELTCDGLRRMVAAYRALDVLAVRAVATSAIRDARNQTEFLRQAGEVIGDPVEIVSGLEEARLIHLGVQTRWPHPAKRVLIIDIGGGSAEIILSENGRLREGFSRPLGAVRLTEMFLHNDPPRPVEMAQMEEFIEEKLAPVWRRIAPGGFDRVIATSATASAAICAANRIPRSRREEANRHRASAVQLKRIYRALGGKDLAARQKVTGIGPRRAEIIVAGVSVLHHILQAVQAPSVYYSNAGVRDGIVADLAERGVGREKTHLTADQRKVVEATARRFGVDLRHARHVAGFARQLFFDLSPLHRLPPEAGRLLDAAAYLRDVGHYISGTAHHKHSEYVVAHSELPGFTEAERQLIALLCRFHRKSMPAQRHGSYQGLPAEQKRLILYLTPLLRIADGLDRNRDQRVNTLECKVSNGNVALNLKSGRDTELEQWAVQQVAEAFLQLYGKSVLIVVDKC